jgi:hypothetical protein
LVSILFRIDLGQKHCSFEPLHKEVYKSAKILSLFVSWSTWWPKDRIFEIFERLFHTFSSCLIFTKITYRGFSMREINFEKSLPKKKIDTKFIKLGFIGQNASLRTLHSRNWCVYCSSAPDSRKWCVYCSKNRLIHSHEKLFNDRHCAQSISRSIGLFWWN